MESISSNIWRFRCIEAGARSRESYARTWSWGKRFVTFLYCIDALLKGLFAATPKCTPQDFYNFQNEILLKYPTYQSPDIPLPATSPITVNASPGLVKAMGIERATSRIDLPYQTLFPPKSSSSSNNSSSSTVGRKQQQQQSLVWPSSASESFVLPLNFDGPAVPQSTSEAGNLFVQNMHVSLANYQIMSEREKAIRRWQIKKADCERSKDQPKQDLPAPCSGSMSSAFQKKFDAIEQLYVSLVFFFSCTVHKMLIDLARHLLFQICKTLSLYSWNYYYRRWLPITAAISRLKIPLNHHQKMEGTWMSKYWRILIWCATVKSCQRQYLPCWSFY